MKIKHIKYSALVGALTIGGILFLTKPNSNDLTPENELQKAETGLINMYERLVDVKHYERAYATLNCAESIRFGQQYLDKFNSLEHLISLKKANDEIRMLNRYDIIDEKLENITENGTGKNTK